MGHKFTGSMAERDQWALDTSDAYAPKFWRRVVKTRRKDGCWLYPSKGRKGYGAFYFANAAMPPHRYALVLSSGLTQNDRYACHRCRNRNCVNPAHLYWGTNEENVADRVRERAGVNYVGRQHGRSLITEADATAVWIDMALTKGKDREIAARTGVPWSIVKNITAETCWTHVTGKLKEQGYARPDRSENSRCRTKGENANRATITDKDVIEIRRYADNGCSNGEIVERSGAGTGVVVSILSGTRWTHVPEEKFVHRKQYRPQKPTRLNVRFANGIRARLAQGMSVARIAREFDMPPEPIERIRDRKIYTKQKGIKL